MLAIQQITQDAVQQQTLVLPDGTSILLTIAFVQMQYGWFIRELTYGDFTIYNLRISNQPNLLYQWKNKLPFGLLCTTKGKREPSQKEDFSSGNSRLFILTEEEVVLYSEILSGQVSS